MKMAAQDLLSLEDLENAIRTTKASKYVIRTPLIRVNPRRFGVQEDVELYFKMEGMQNMGSFKIRGIVNQMERAPPDVRDGSRTLVTMSAGNYGRSFAYMCHELGVKGLVLMPLTAPANRVKTIRGYGPRVEQMPTQDLQATVDRYVAEEGMIFMHSFDDPTLIAGYAGVAEEAFEDLEGGIDVFAVCCGGGGLLSGVAAMAKLSGYGSNTRIIGVEPEGACTMYLSLKEGRPVTKGDAKSVASGLAPPYAGKNAYELVKKYAEGVVLVTESEIRECVKLMYENGLVVEPSGAAALAAVRYGKITDIGGKRVVITVSGSNVSPLELTDLLR